MKIDSQEGFFLQGYGRCVYWLAGILLFFFWLALSNIEFKNGKKYLVVIKDGMIDTHEDDYDVIRLLAAYYNVVKALGVDPMKYILLVRSEESTNAFAVGLNKRKTICVFQGALEKASQTELESIIAHEFGHTVNKDNAFAVIRISLGCGIGLAGGLIGFIIVWLTWGFGSAVLFSLFCGTVIPAITNYANRVTEQFADSYAALHGFGPGLQSFFKELDWEKRGYFESHPHPKVRIDYIQKIIDADEGAVPNKLEKYSWMILKVSVIALAAIYLYFNFGHSLQPIIPFLLSGGFFLAADSMMSSNGGSIKAVLQINKTNGSNSSKLISTLVRILLLAILFASGIWASYLFATSPSIVLSLLAKICLYAWSIKPVVSLIGHRNDLAATVSDLTTYTALVTSLLMMASFFIVI